MLSRRSLPWLCVAAALLAPVRVHAADDADPFAVCKAVTDRDEPATAKRIRRPILTRMAKALDLRMSARELGAMREAFYWRCMHGNVYVCFVGANIPCWSKADTRRTSEGAANYCAEHPNEDFVPAYATGHETVWLWGCEGSRPAIRNEAPPLDPHGFRIDTWVWLEPPR